MRKIILVAGGLSMLMAWVIVPVNATERHHKRVVRTGPYVNGPAHYSGYDPNWPNPMLKFYRENHICAIDEGYGRATRCD